MRSPEVGLDLALAGAERGRFSGQLGASPVSPPRSGFLLPALRAGCHHALLKLHAGDAAREPQHRRRRHGERDPAHSSVQCLRSGTCSCRP